MWGLVMITDTSDSAQRSLLLCRSALVLLTVAVFGVSLHNGFVWDDNIFMVKNPAYKDFDLRSILFSIAGTVEYYPVTALTFALDFKIWGANPFGFHLTNMLLFIGNVLVVHNLAEHILDKCTRLTGQKSSWFAAFAVAAGFAVHPINAEPVNYIAARNVLLAGLFFFLSIISMIKYLERQDATAPKMYPLAIVAFVCAMLSKATAIVLPFLLLSILPLLFPGKVKRILALLAPFFAISFGFFLLIKNVADSVGFTNITDSPANISGKLLVALQIPFFYLKKLLYPHAFSVEYITDFAADILSLKVVMAFFLLLLLLVTAVVTRRRTPAIAVGICWFFVALLPVLNFLATNPVVADRYAYLPSFGVMLVMGVLFDRLTQVKIKLLLFTPLICILAFISVNRSLEWKSEESFWKANVRNLPTELKSILGLAAYYFNAGQQQKSIELLSSKGSLPWVPFYLNYFKAKYLIEQKNFDTGKLLLQQGLDAGNFVCTLRALGQLAENEGDFVAAVKYYNKALSPGQNDIFTEQPFVRQRLKEIKRLWLDAHLSALTGRLAQNPANTEARKELALTLDQLGFYQEALDHYLVFEKSGVKGWQIHHNIANCFFNLNMPDKAVRAYEQSVALGDSTEEALNNMGVAYRRLKAYDKSILALQQARNLYPQAPYPLFNLGVTYYAAGREKDARTVFAEVSRNFPGLRDRVSVFNKKLSAQAN